MNLFLIISLWAMAALFTWAAIRSIATIGKTKPPTTAPVAAGAVVIQAFFIFVIVLAALAVSHV